MKKVYFKEIENKVVKLISSNQFSTVYLLKDGRFFKMFNPIIVKLLKNNGSDIERKILDAKKIDNVPEIIIPDSIVYDKNYFLGYTILPAKGISFVEDEDNKSKEERCNLYRYALEQVKLENIIKRANNEGIVFPDLLTCDNIFISDSGYQFIDYDGIQIGNIPVLQLSTMLGDDEQYEIPKYMDNNGLYNSNIDKKSLLLLYYLSAFNINLNMVGIINPYDGKRITLDDVFNIIGLKNYDLMQATYLAVNDKLNDNIYLDSIPYQIADEYNLTIVGSTPDGDLKRLIKK